MHVAVLTGTYVQHICRIFCGRRAQKALGYTVWGNFSIGHDKKVQ
jgi:hypothetical protein